MSIQVIGLVVAVAGLAMSGVSMWQQSAAQKRQAKHNAEIQENNAKVARWAAEKELEEGDRQVQDHFRKVAAMRGRQKSLLAAGGADVNFGTAAELLEDTTILGDADAALIKTQSKMRAWDREVQAVGLTASAGLFSSQASNISPLADAGGAMLSGAGNVMDAIDKTGWLE